MKCRMETSVISDSMCKCSMDENENNRIDPVKTGEFIKKLRKSHKLTQEELGAKLFITRKAVSKWENGVCCPSLDLLKRLSVLLDVSIEELTNGEFSSSPLRHSRIGKIFRNKHIMRISITVIALLFLLLFLFFIFNFNKTRCYSMNYESESFSMTNGQLFLSNNDSYISLGDFVTNFTDVDENTKFNFVLLIMDKNNSKEILNFDRTENTTLEKNIASELKDNINKLSIKVYYRNIRGEDIKFVFKPKIKLKKSNSINETNNVNASLNYSVDNDDNVLIKSNNNIDVDNKESFSDNLDISFLYEDTFNELFKKFNGEVFSYENIYFKIQVDINSDTICITSENSTTVINLRAKRILTKLDSVLTYTIENKEVKLINNAFKHNEFLKTVIYKLKNI